MRRICWTGWWRRRTARTWLVTGFRDWSRRRSPVPWLSARLRRWLAIWRCWERAVDRGCIRGRVRATSGSGCRRTRRITGRAGCVRRFAAAASRVYSWAMRIDSVKWRIRKSSFFFPRSFYTWLWFVWNCGVFLFCFESFSGFDFFG